MDMYCIHADKPRVVIGEVEDDIVKLSVGHSRRLGEGLPAPVPANPNLHGCGMKGQKRAVREGERACLSGRFW
jgi:hypothetical protein